MKDLNFCGCGANLMTAIPLYYYFVNKIDAESQHVVRATAHGRFCVDVMCIVTNTYTVQTSTM
jgi:hypothetical protein